MPWELGSGLRSDYDFHVQSAYFAPDAQYNDGQTILLQLEGVDEDNEFVKEMFSVGRDWTSPDGGETIISTKGAKTINKTSMYGHFISAAFECDSKLPDFLASRGDATDAKVWIGLVFHMNEKEISFGRNLNSTFRNMPSKYLGMEGQQTLASQSGQPRSAQAAVGSPTRPANAAPVQSPAERIAAAKEAAQASQTVPTQSPVSANGHGPDTIALQSLAESSPDLASFINSAVELDGVSEDDELLNLVLDPTDNGFYALYHK